ncbi:MAG: M23 family metallopeptidase [bacterium]|nr:M23 family metallopeptidase [bacterium]
MICTLASTIARWFVTTIGLCVFALTTSANLLSQDLRFSIPVEGVLGRDVVVVNHVDHDSATGRFKDHTCGVQTYDGHDGTDFVLRSFRQMDSGVYVVAAAPGHVVAVVDSLYDRNKISVKERGFGNYIAIQHAEGFISYYAHIRTGSALVRVGDIVKRNARMAFVGSSGNSSDPHVHFEVWRRVDPFAGACADDLSLWQSQPDYNTTYRLLDRGVTAWPPLLDTIRERPPKATHITRNDSTITFWSLSQGILPTDEITAIWIAPDNAEWFRYTSTAGVASEYFYWWTYINRPSFPGIYRVRFLVNGIERSLDTFEVDAVTGIRDEHTADEHTGNDVSPSVKNTNRLIGSRAEGIDVEVRGNTLRLRSGASVHVGVHDLTGRLLFSTELSGEGSTKGSASVDLPNVPVVVRLRRNDVVTGFVYSGR